MAYVDTRPLPRNDYAARRAGGEAGKVRPADTSNLNRISKMILSVFVIVANIALLAAIFPAASDALASVTGSVFAQIGAPAR